MEKVERFSRVDTSVLGKWWWTVDRWLLGSILLLMILGLLLTLSGSPLVAQRIGLSSFHFVYRHFLMIFPSLLVMVSVSLMSVTNIRRLSFLLLLVSFGLLIVTLFAGVEIKGARRWVNIFGVSLQPSEILKPTLAVVMAWVFAQSKKDPKFPGVRLSLGLLGVSLSLLLLQPDLGMAVVVTCMWGAQIFLSGLSWLWIILCALVGVVVITLAYLLLPHVSKRIDQFFDPSAGDHYQIIQSLEAFKNGGFFGQGPGEGDFKKYLPDAHADFIFSVAGEEFGMVFCLLLIGIFVFILVRGFTKALEETNYFIMLATTGLLIQFGAQALINMASSVHLIPTKGMTLPFVSYGGSSLLTLSMAMGMVLAFTRRRRER